MAASVLEFLPPAGDRWLWADRSSGRIITVPLRWRTEGGRHDIELGSVPDHPFNALFDRLIVSNAGLEIARLRMQSRSFDIRPTLAAAIGASGSRVANALPGLTDMIGMASPPFDAVVSYSDLGEEGESPWSRLTQWEIDVAVRGRDGTVAMRARWRWLKDLGLASYMGDVYGVFFRYDHHPRLQFDGVWVAPAHGVVFTLAQQGRAVTGGFTHEGFTGELTGTFDRKTISFEWSLLPDKNGGAAPRGRGELTMDEDGMSLRGHFALKGEATDWVLVHTPPPELAEGSMPGTTAPANISTAIRAYHSRGAGGSQNTPSPFRGWASQVQKQIWDCTAERGRSGRASPQTETKIRKLTNYYKTERDSAYRKVDFMKERDERYRRQYRNFLRP